MYYYFLRKFKNIRSHVVDEHEENLFGQNNTKDERASFSLGAQYTLPWLVVLQGEVYQDGYIRFQWLVLRK